MLFLVGLGMFLSTGAIYGELQYEVEIGNYGQLSTLLGGSALTGNAGILGALLALIILALAFKAPSLIEDALGVGGRPPKKK